MKIKIKYTVEFEKIIGSQHFESQHLTDFQGPAPRQIDTIEITRNRINLQQSLDSEEHDKKLLADQLANYCKLFDVLFQEISRNYHQKMKSIPLFAWQVDNEEIISSCWKVEQIIPKVLLSRLFLDLGHSALPNYKLASINYEKAITTHEQIKKNLSNWKWRNPDMNHTVLQTDWHDSCIAHLQSLQHMAMLSKGIENKLPSKTLCTVSERAVKSSVSSIAKWTSNYEPDNTLPACQAIQMYYSSKLLWDDAKYGHSIYRLQKLHDSNFTEKTKFEAINGELEKVGFLLSENKRTNNGAYFDTVEMGEPLKLEIFEGLCIQ
jgi:hypothetical protein